MMKKSMMALAMALAFATGAQAQQAPEAQIVMEAPAAMPMAADQGHVEGSMGEASFVIGLRFGQGVLEAQNQALKFRLSGITIFSVGLAAGNFTGTVSNLHNLADFEGRYTMVEAGAAYVVGANVQRWVNDKGVVVEVHGLEIGAELRLGGGVLGVHFTDPLPAATAMVDAPMAPQVQLDVAPVTEKVRLEGEVHFGFDRADLSDQGKMVLDDLLAKSMSGSSRIEIAAVGGHADRIGESFYNHDLALRRALVVGKYLVAHGVPESKLDMREFGQSQPRVACEGERGSALVDCLAPNRRAEVVIIVSRAQSQN